MIVMITSMVKIMIPIMVLITSAELLLVMLIIMILMIMINHPVGQSAIQKANPSFGKPIHHSFSHPVQSAVAP